MELRDSNIALNVFFTGITPRQEFGAPSKGGLERAIVSPRIAISPSLLVIRSRVMSFHEARPRASFAGQFLRSHGLGRACNCPESAGGRRVPAHRNCAERRGAHGRRAVGTGPGSRRSGRGCHLARLEPFCIGGAPRVSHAPGGPLGMLVGCLGRVLLKCPI
jgi:hypothetical protein